MAVVQDAELVLQRLLVLCAFGLLYETLPVFKCLFYRRDRPVEDTASELEISQAVWVLVGGVIRREGGVDARDEADGGLAEGAAGAGLEGALEIGGAGDAAAGEDDGVFSGEAPGGLANVAGLLVGWEVLGLECAEVVERVVDV